MRRSGVLLHPTSLPGNHGSGDLGEQARRFIDWLVEAEQSAWQLLPLGGLGAGNSPYMSDSAFAGNPLLIDLHELQQRGWLDAADLEPDRGFARMRVAYELVTPWRMQRLERAAQRFFSVARSDRRLAEDFAAFRREQGHWLEDYALFKALAERHPGIEWHLWPSSLARREPVALDEARHALSGRIDHWCFLQWCFARQWQSLRNHARAKSIRLIGDVPIFVGQHSADVWANPHLFQLDAQGRPEAVAGVPPDYFSRTGQRWGNPLYRWDMHERDGYAWWIARLRHALTQVDEIRIDHFRGFAAYWRVPYEALDATRGQWIRGPGEALFKALEGALGPLPVIAEDLGLMTPDVPALRRALGFPGMKVLQFAWDGAATNAHLPHNHEPATVVYTGTHDNDTTRSWWLELDAATQQRVRRYLGDADGDHEMLLRAAGASVADTAILPMQDILGLAEGARMNTPGLAAGCWEWRFDWSQASAAVTRRLVDWCQLYGRTRQAATMMQSAVPSYEDREGPLDGETTSMSELP